MTELIHVGSVLDADAPTVLAGLVPLDRIAHVNLFVVQGPAVHEKGPLFTLCLLRLAFDCARWVVKHGGFPSHLQHDVLSWAVRMDSRYSSTSYPRLRFLTTCPQVNRSVGASEWNNIGWPRVTDRVIHWTAVDLLLQRGFYPADMHDKLLPYQVRDAYRVIWHRITACRRVVCLLLSRCLRDQISHDVLRVVAKDRVWPTRRKPCWTPAGVIMPLPFT